ncbi:MAG: Rz1-like lysis system protein LysC [Sulfobacillus sp.]
MIIVLSEASTIKMVKAQGRAEISSLDASINQTSSVGGFKICIIAAVVGMVLLTSSCASIPPPLPPAVIPITIVHHRYVPVPANLLQPCPSSNLAKIATNRDALFALLYDQASLRKCNGQLSSIKHLPMPNKRHK